LIVCGSATSWIINNLINNHGGLYNRLTTSIFLKPFTLLECEKYFKARKISAGGTLTKILQDLEYCDFVRHYNTFNRKKRDVLYQLIDPYTLFYFRFVAKNEYDDTAFWSNSLDTPLRNTWAGFAFEMLMLLHAEEIKKALGISGIQTAISAWRSKKTSPAAQIDMVINRKDGIINLVEIKFSRKQYTITKQYEENLQNKIAAFKEETKTTKALHLLMITTNGVKQNRYAELVQKQLTLSDIYG
jgi:hypothetical protein